MTDAVQLGRAKPGQVPLPDLDDPDQRKVLQQPSAEKRVTGDLPICGPVAAVLDDLLVDMLGAEQAQEAGVRGRDQDCSPPGTAGVQDVVPEHVRVDHHRRRAQQDISRERAPGSGKRIGATVLYLCISATAPRTMRTTSSTESGPFPTRRGYSMPQLRQPISKRSALVWRSPSPFRVT
jgi:hypothetical protein